MADVNCFRVFGSGTPRTCAQCRRRKVRCDKRPGTCLNCERLNLQCSPLDETADETRQTDFDPPAHGYRDGLQRRKLRSTRACAACKSKKIKCSGTLPSCATCKERGRSCTYPASKRQLRLSQPVTDSRTSPPADAQSPEGSTQLEHTFMSLPHPPDSAHASEATSIRSPGTSVSAIVPARIDNQNPNGPTQHELASLVEIFFHHVYPMPSYAFLHPQTTRRRCHNKDSHRALSLALCSVANLYSRAAGNSRPLIQQRITSAWVQIAEQNIWLNMDRPNISRLQALLLVIHYHMETGRFPRAFMLIATAARSAAAMRLNHERQHLDAIAQEVGRRVIWSLKIVERYFSVGLAEFNLLPTEVIYCDYPQKEEDFSEQPAEDQTEAGAYRMIIRLEGVRWDIMRLSRNITLLEKPLSSLPELIDHHRNALAGVGAPPPMELGVTTEPVALIQDRWLPRRILAHISWHQAHCDLYRILLPGYSEAAPSTVLEGYDQAALLAAEENCMHHASRIIHILTTLNQHSDRYHLLEYDTAICAYHATRLLLFVSRFGSGPNRFTPEFALSRGQLCLAALKRFFLSSALVAPIIRELEQSMQVFADQQLQHSQTSSRPVSAIRKANGYVTSTGNASYANKHDSGTLVHRSSGSKSPNRANESHGKQLSAAAEARQRLAIHSLLRRADFPGDDNEEDEADDIPGGPGKDTQQSGERQVVTEACHLGIEPQPTAFSAQESTQSAQVSPDPHVSPHHNLPTTLLSPTAVQNMTNVLDNARVTSIGQGMNEISWDNGQSYDIDANTPSTVSYHDPADPFMGFANNGGADTEMFAWWGPQDWGWLFDRGARPEE